MTQRSCERVWYFIFLTVLCGGCFFGSALITYIYLMKPVVGAELELPDYIKCGESQCFRYKGGDINQFGQYSLPYMQRRWKKMCGGPARYDAMREADDMGQPQPCGS